MEEINRLKVVTTEQQNMILAVTRQTAELQGRLLANTSRGSTGSTYKISFTNFRGDEKDRESEYVAFETRCRHIIHLNKIPFPDACGLVLAHCTGPASATVRRMSDPEIYSRFRNLDEFFEALRKLFMTPAYVEKARTAFMSRKQHPDESIAVYHSEMRELFDRGFSGETVDERIMTRQFVLGLRHPQVCAKMAHKIHKFKDSTEAMQKAIDYEGSCEAIEHEFQQRKAGKVSCSSSHNFATAKGATEAAPEAMEVDAVERRRFSRGKPKAGRPEPTYQKDKKQSNCFECGRFGHWANECRSGGPGNKSGYSSQKQTRGHNQSDVGQHSNRNRRNGYPATAIGQAGKESQTSSSDEESKNRVRRSIESCAPDTVVCSFVDSILNIVKGASEEPSFVRVYAWTSENKRVKFKALPDSGNRAMCLLRKDILDKIMPGATLKKVNSVITTAKKGDVIKIVGKVVKPIEFCIGNNYLYKCKPLIVENLQLPCLLSARDLIKMKAAIDFPGGKLFLEGRKYQVPLVHMSKKRAHPVFLTRNEVIPARSEMILPVKTLIQGNNILMEPCGQFEQKFNITMGCSVNLVKASGLSRVRLINPHNHRIKLSKDEQVAVATIMLPNQIQDKKKRNSLTTKVAFDKLKLEKNNHLTCEKKTELCNLMVRYQDVIAQGPGDIGLCKEVQCSLKTMEGRTVKSKARPLQPHLKENLKEQIKTWEEKGIVERAPESCPFSSPLVPVLKKNGQVRWAVDYRALNDITVKDYRPIPNVMDKLANIKANTNKPLRYFGSLDLQDAFHNVPLSEDSKDKTAVITPFGLYRFLRMPFGLQGAPQAFNELVYLLEEKIEKADLEGAKQVLIYFDDCLICASSWREFLKLLELFLKQLRKMNLKINLEKCSLGLPSIKWLGHELSDKGTFPSSDLTSAIEKWPTPKNSDEVRSFFGTASYYRRFIRGFSDKTEQMRKLLKKDEPFGWKACHQKEFDALKKELCQKPVLAHPDFSKSAKPFVVYVDSSKTGVGAVLSQEQHGYERVIAYASKSLTSGEQHYGAYKKELLGAVYALTHFRYYLLGRKFVVRTDHKALEWLLKTRSKENLSLIYRWQDVVTSYDFDIEYVPATRMKHVDGLSRKPYEGMDRGVIPDLPDYDEAQRTTKDDFWQVRMKKLRQQVIAAVADRPVRERRAPKRFGEEEFRLTRRPKTTPVRQPREELSASHSQDDNVEESDTEVTEEVQESVDMEDHARSIEKLIAEQAKDVLCKTFHQYIQDRNLENLQQAIRRHGLSHKLLGNRAKFNIDSRNLLRFGLNVVIPKAMRQQVIKLVHMHEAHLHPGVRRTLILMRDRVWWPTMAADVEIFIQECNQCIRKDQHPVLTEMGETTTSANRRKFQKWSCDIFSLKTSEPEGYRHLLTMMDYQTRWLEAYKLVDDTAESIVHCIKEQFAPRYGYGITLQTDRAKNFLSKRFQQVCNQLNYDHVLVLPYSPQANPVERVHRQLNANLRILLANKPDEDWSKEFNKALWAYRSNPSIYGTAPFEAAFEEKPLTPLDIFLAQNPPRKIREVADDINAITIQDKRKANLKYQQRKATKMPTITIFQPGDLVDIWRPYDSEDYHRTRKLIRHWDGPYAVWEHNPKSPYKVSIVLASTYGVPTKIAHFHIKHVKLHGRVDDNIITIHQSPFQEQNRQEDDLLNEEYEDYDVIDENPLFQWRQPSLEIDTDTSDSEEKHSTESKNISSSIKTVEKDDERKRSTPLRPAAIDPLELLLDDLNLSDIYRTEDMSLGLPLSPQTDSQMSVEQENRKRQRTLQTSTSSSSSSLPTHQLKKHRQHSSSGNQQSQDKFHSIPEAEEMETPTVEKPIAKPPQGRVKSFRDKFEKMFKRDGNDTN